MFWYVCAELQLAAVLCVLPRLFAEKLRCWVYCQPEVNTNYCLLYQHFSDVDGHCYSHVVNVYVVTSNTRMSRVTVYLLSLIHI